MIDSLGGVPREQKMLKGHLPRVIYHQLYEDNIEPDASGARQVHELSGVYVKVDIRLPRKGNSNSHGARPAGGRATRFV